MSIENIIALIAALGVGGILGAILNRWFEQQKQTNEHDLKIFNRSNEILTELKLSDIANFHLLSDHSLDDDDFHLLIRWIRFFSETGNQYLDKRLIKHSQELLDDLDRLPIFIGYNFFRIKEQNPSNKNQYLRPDWNMERGEPSPEQMDKYDKYASELEELTQKTISQYSKYRLSIKQILKI